ncbi:MAG: hypothetical protein HY318_08680, partial [Armatimonadetes bacterium]|nr:hypothetical protein [Armatimonadota bacterium]
MKNSTCTTLLCLAFILCGLHSRGYSQETATTIWATGSALMPGWGLYPNGSEYGGTKPLGDYAAWGTGKLTWVADFPSAGSYQVWVRKYGGYGNVAVTVDERAVSAGKGGPGGGRYVWQHAGETAVTKGRHHVDLTIGGTMLDAALFTTDTNLQPEQGTLPDPVKQPQVSAPRRYRDDSSLKPAAGKKGYIVSSVPPYEELLNDHLPSQEQVIDRLKLSCSPDQYISGTFTVRALEQAKELSASLNSLVGPKNAKLGPGQIDLRVVHLRMRMLSLYEGVQKTLCPDLLLRDDRTVLPPKGRQGGFGGGVCVTDIPAHESRQFWLTVHAPDKCAPGTY